ncbi:hypothetical protein FLBR109950_07415 [Flavobacterium branchiophilum]|uniref:Uncharacterized protein n=1 Tax=Flavobacterium branchiophilum (strain FL-15) TaxID=1034807 RepID=G2Z3K9_FLABF|nr:hypothetical protein [Flavobacterium branchiophilum]CCB70458.1 Hypothetical protein FBFL15_2452 [Flavobacterium branchiophilum FL-15]
MNVTCFQNIIFRIREIELLNGESVLISTNSLNELLLDKNGKYVSQEANYIDEKIFFFVEDDEIEFTNDRLINLITRATK